MPSDQVLKHAVGKSTLVEGFAVPKLLEEWIGAPGRGCRREIALLFDGRRQPVTLRRLNTARGPVQVKYEDRRAGAFRDWLRERFPPDAAGRSGDYFELHKVDGDTFRVVPCPRAGKANALRVADWLFHHGSERFLSEATFAELQAIVQSVDFLAGEGQAHYNRVFARHFAAWSWEAERRVVPDLGLKSDFVKDATWVEIEFGNARTYYQDYLKFLLAGRYSSARVGVLVVPGEAFARHLCAVGRLRAQAKGRSRYSGMIHFEKVKREFRYLEFLLTMPVAIAGIEMPG